MASLDAIKTRIESVEATKKITSAMELVATAKLKKARERFEQIDEYSTLVYTKINELLSSMDDKNSKYLNDVEGNTLFVLVTSDMGLCGGYNANALKLYREMSKPGDQVIAIGNKAINNFKANNISPQTVYANTKGSVEYCVANQVTQDIQSIFEDESFNITKVQLIYTKFINNVTFEATALQLLPAVADESKEVSKIDYTFEPSAKDVFENMIPLYLKSVIYGKAAESYLSEQAARRSAMENANDNAKELIETLDIQYNRIRQANITQEISEIVAGADAI